MYKMEHFDQTKGQRRIVLRYTNKIHNLKIKKTYWNVQTIVK